MKCRKIFPFSDEVKPDVLTIKVFVAVLYSLAYNLLCFTLVILPTLVKCSQVKNPRGSINYDRNNFYYRC
jgi:hypothetical protein